MLKVAQKNSKSARFGFIVSKKISKSAVVRNKIRRRLSEAIKSIIKEIKTGADVALIALPGIEKKDFSEIEKSLAVLLKKAGLL